jgi:hypothetical protein
MNIGEQTVDAIVSAAKILLTERIPDLAQAYDSSEENFTIPITAKLRPCAEGTRIVVSTGFITGRVKDSAVRIVCESQTELFQ